MRRASSFISALLALAVIAGGGAAAWLYTEFNRPGPSTEAVTVVLPQGAGLGSIGRRLDSAGVLGDALVFRLGVRLLRAERRLQAGEYSIPAAASPRQIMELIISGVTVARRITVAEGVTVAQVMALLEATDGLTGELDGMPPEGSLLPETYHFSLGDGRAELLARMQADLKSVLAKHWAARQPGLPIKTPEEALVLASIVEKETSVPDERPRIAGVFINRLRKRMRLQSDPTVAYGITNGSGPLDRPLTFRDLERDSPYNTYRIYGLPPAPIALPGEAAIEAVLNPLPTNELYFVADGTGGHAFAKSLVEHNRNVQKWRRIQRQNRTSRTN